MANNSLLKNAALAGASAGMLQGRNIGQLAAGEIAAITAAALAFAVDVDAAIPEEATISAAGGLSLPPTTDDITTDESAAVIIMAELCKAAWAGRANPGATIAGAQAAMVTAVAAQWVSLYAARTTP